MRRLGAIIRMDRSNSANENLPNGIKRIGSETGTDGNTPTESEGGQERTLESANENDGL